MGDAASDIACRRMNRSGISGSGPSRPCLKNSCPQCSESGRSRNDVNDSVRTSAGDSDIGCYGTHPSLRLDVGGPDYLVKQLVSCSTPFAAHTRDISGHRYRFSLKCGRVHRPAAGARGLLEAESERQKLLLTEGRAEEGDADWKVVSGESCGHDQIRKTREIGEVRRRNGRAWRSGVGRRGEQLGPAGRCRIHDRVKLLCREETLEGCTHQRQAVITDRCVAVVLETSARCFALERSPATWIRARAILTWCGEAIGPVDRKST